MIRSVPRRLALAAGTAVVASLALAGVASAHIDPDPTQVMGGETVTVAFTVEHGCDGSPTTKLEIQAPETATDPTGIDVAGFTASTSGRVVTFSGGSLGADTEQAFQVRFGAPVAGGSLAFPIIQTCEQGSIEWIEVQQPGQAEPEHPAPVVDVTPAATTNSSTTAAAGASTTSAAPVSSTAAAPDDTKGSGDVSSTVVADAEKEEEGSSSTPTVIGVVVFVILLVGAGIFGYRYARTHNAGGLDDPTPPAGGEGPPSEAAGLPTEDASGDDAPPSNDA